MIVFCLPFSPKIGGLVSNGHQKFPRCSAAASEIWVYIRDNNRDKENIEDQDNIERISSEESVNSQELEEAPRKRSISITKHSSGKMGNALS